LVLAELSNDSIAALPHISSNDGQLGGHGVVLRSSDGPGH